ncbi:site-specific DNA-methyltransferase [Nitratiruptor sp. YY09-18]|uniref:DNA-methyltransferase n=1 Tax=Nitratiruptor sp. YY09-18 TaxID=2724901 RepID=UPI0019154F4C|nr:site-specific DNA-methyltransferase [Nitratiruptor sp. YY09-18]BCD68619.1 site-specific DNA-methyltransferase (adenine-specific) [Nitratiruptor sp. YY09-18]
MIFWKKDNIKIYNADILDKNLFDKEFIDLIVTSPPYNVDINYDSHHDAMSYGEYLDFSHKWLKNCYEWSKKSARLCLNIPLDKNKGGLKPVGADITNIAQKAGWKYQSTIIWNEGNISRRTAWGSWMSASAPYVIAPVELIVIFYKEQWKKVYKGTSDITKEEFMQWTNGLWTFSGESKKRVGHPAPFPRELPRRCIKLFSYVGDTVFDPFMGSGTTLIESALLNRNGVGVDISQEYCELAKKRIMEETDQKLFVV